MTIHSDMPTDMLGDVSAPMPVTVPDSEAPSGVVVASAEAVRWVHLRFARDMSMNLARQCKLAGDTKGQREHLGYAVYWHVRVMQPLLSVAAASIRAHERGKRFGVRSPEAQQATLAAAVAGMNKPEARPFVPMSCVTGGAP